MHHHVMGSSLPNAFTNGGPSQDPRMHAAVEMSAHAARMSTLPNMLSAQGANMGLMPGLNSQIIRSETDYVGTPSYIFGTDGNVMEASPSIADASVASLSSMASNSHPMPEPLDAENNYGYLSQIPRNFSFTDLTADFAKSSGFSPLHVFLCLCVLVCACWHASVVISSPKLDMFYVTLSTLFYVLPLFSNAFSQ
uniref:Uncharacterized protein LOC105634412 isoform X2 n=1 Tax=Rhizophora mucronata TaxID=61149 RepID=A0A2P2KHP4_RHIMU